MRLAFRNGVEIDDPLRYALAFLQNDYSYRSYDSLVVAQDATLTLDDIRSGNRIGARMAAVESDALFARREQFEVALARIAPESSLCDPEDAVPWAALSDLYAAANGVRGIGLAKVTKFLHKKRPMLIPMLDSVVEGYLRSVSEIPMAGLGFGVIGMALTRSYKVDLDVNLDAIRAVGDSLAERGYQLSECRILDLFTWAYAGDAEPAWAAVLTTTPLAAVDDVAELAADVGVPVDGDSRVGLEAMLETLGYVRARRVLREWRGDG